MKTTYNDITLPRIGWETFFTSFNKTFGNAESSTEKGFSLLSLQPLHLLHKINIIAERELQRTVAHFVHLDSPLPSMSQASFYNIFCAFIENLITPSLPALIIPQKGDHKHCAHGHHFIYFFSFKVHCRSVAL